MTLLFFALPTICLWLLWVAVVNEWRYFFNQRREVLDTLARNQREILKHERAVLECWHKTPKHYACAALLERKEEGQ